MDTAPRCALWLGLVAAAGCTRGTTDKTTTDRRDSGGGPEDSAARDTSAPGGDWTVVFEDDLQVDNPDDIIPGVGLPTELFPEDASRWTSVQNSHPGENTMVWEDGHVRFVALGRPDPEASKADVGRALLTVGMGDTVRLRARLRFDGSVGTAPTSTTLLDLEEFDDIRIDGEGTGAGLRVRLDARGFIELNRGELVPALTDADRMRGLKSTTTLPVDVWVQVEAIVKLGIATPASTIEPIDTTFDADTTDAWCALWLTPEGGERTLVMRQQGTTFIDRAVWEERLAELAPDLVVEWSDTVTYDTFQVGLTNNRSEVDQALAIDDIEVAVRR